MSTKIANKIKLILCNKIFIYLFTRYFTYFIQFLTSIIIAVKLGPYYFGIWGFILLIINYFQIFNFGIPNSLNILMVQYKTEPNTVKSFVSSSIFLNGIICCLVILFSVYYSFFGISFFAKYEIGRLFYIVCAIGILVYMNNLFMTIYRVKNSLFEIAFYQSIVPILLFVALFFVKDQKLLLLLVSFYLLGEFFSFCLFLFRKKIPFGGKITGNTIKILLKKSFFLFVYNLCFYLIIVSTKTLISIFYPVSDFGFFAFAYTLANAILKLLQALSFVVFPKIIDKLNTKDTDKIDSTINKLRINYVSMAHGLIYIGFMLFPLFLHIVPKYESTQITFNLIALTILLYTNAFGYNSFLMAQNQDRTIAKISIFSLLVNIVLVIILIKLINVEYSYVIIATMFSYFLYSYLCVYHGKIYLKSNTNYKTVINSFFPIKLLVPYCIAVFVTIINIKVLLFFPLLFFVMMNKNTLKEIFITIKNIMMRPNIINI